MKKFLSIVVVFLMLFGYTPTLASTIELFEKDTINILEKSTEKAVIIQSNKTLVDLKLYVAAYKGDTMIGAVSKTIDISVGENHVEMTPTWTMQERDIVKIFLWDKNMSPKADRIIAKTPTIAVSDVYADFETGTAKVEVSVLNNPGISSLKFDIAYDKELTLLDVELNEAFGAYVTTPVPYTNPQSVSVLSPLQEIAENGRLATLTFDISKVDKRKAFSTISVKCDNENIFDENLEEITFETVDGKIIFNDTSLTEYFDDSVLMEVPQMKLVIGETAGMPGEDVKVEINLNNNPGIASLKFDVLYDDVLTLKTVTFNSAFGAYITAPEPYKNPQTISMISPMQEIDVNGNVATLTFTISEEAKDGYVAEIDAVYDEDNLFDGDYNNVALSVEKGKVSIYEGIPGDINADGKVNNKDAVLLFRYIAGWNVDVDEEALDVTGDDKVTNKDAIELFRYVAGWTNITLYRGKACEHALTKTDGKSATCTEDGNIEYWQCSKCGKYYSDAKATKNISKNDTVEKAKGHTIVIDEYVAPTYTEMGLTEGKHCSVCNSVIVKQEDIPVLKRDEYSIQYVCDMVAPGDTTFIKTDTYKPTQTKVLQMPKMDTYKFLGWSDKNGKMYGTEIPKGTTGDLVLYANWASNRNKAVPSKNIGSPIICEDSENGQIIFVYEIGKIENIPLFETQDLLVANGLITSTGIVKQKSITKANAEEIGKTIANTTTNSATWSLSKDWNETTSVSEEWAKENGMSVEEAEAFSKNSSNTYNMVNSSGGSSSLVQSNNSYYRTTENEAHSKSEYDDNQKYSEFNVDAKFSTETTSSLKVNAGIEIPLGVAKASAGVEAGVSNTTAFEISGGYTSKDFTQNTKTGTDNWSKSIDSVDSSSSTSTDVKTWNTSQGYSTSESTSATTSVAKAVSELISQKNSKDSTYSTGGTNGESKEYASSKAQEDLYSSSVTYSEAEIEISERKFESTGNTYGAYRLVQVGMARVYAVVGYDIRNKSYYVYTYSVLDDDEYKEYLDYSFDRTFDDYECSVLPFEVPIFVNEYVNSRIASSKLQINDEGIVTKYLGKEDDEIVLIPSYYTKTNNTTNEAEFVKIKGIAPRLFKNKTHIVGISLGNFVNEIPESAFEGCTALKEVVCPNVMSIGKNAFKGCTALSEFNLPNEINYIGEDAFYGVNAIKSVAPTKEIANIVAKSNVKNITLDISNINDDDFSDMTFDIGKIECFKLIGGRKTYKGLSIKSIADHTVISGITISDCDRIPLEITSEKLTLERVNAESDGFVLVLNGDTTIEIEGVSELNSMGEDAIIAKNIVLNQINEETYSEIKTSGNVLVCGSITGNDGYIDKKKIKTITEEEYINLLNQHYIYFDANGGQVEKDSISVVWNTKIGELPIPKQNHCSFEGWYTQRTGGEKVTADYIYRKVGNMTLYAHWKLIAYSVNWETGVGYSIKVKRVSSPYANAEIGDIISGSKVYYGDVLEVTYVASTGYSLTKQGSTSITVAGNVNSKKIYASSALLEYGINWNIGTGYSINVNRTSSPYANAEIGDITIGSKVYYGDVLKVIYTPAPGYSLSKSGATNITVKGNVTSSDIYAVATVNSYTYNVVYKSSNGTVLGSSTVTNQYGTACTVSAKDFDGYLKPADQYVEWNSTSAKTITFIYTPQSVGTATVKNNDWWWKDTNTRGIQYTVTVAFSNRTSDSVVATITWTNTILPKTYYGYYTAYSMVIGGSSSGTKRITENSTWSSQASYSRSRTHTTTMTIKGLSPTQTSVSYTATPSAYSGATCPSAFSGTLTIPTY